MPNEVLQKTGTRKTWKASGGDAAITLAGLANNAGRQGVKLDLGATRAAQYAVRVTFGFAVAPTAGNVVEVYWSASSSVTAATDNDGAATGADAAYPTSGTLDDVKKQLMLLGCLTDYNSTAEQTQTIGRFSPPERYGMPVVVNKSGQAFQAAEGGMKIEIIPIVDEVQ